MLTNWIVEQKASSGKRGLCAVKLTLLQDAPGGSASAPENGCNFVSVLKHLIKFIIKSVIFPTAVTDQVALDQNETHRVVRFHPRRRCSKLVQTFHPHLTERETMLVIFCFLFSIDLQWAQKFIRKQRRKSCKAVERATAENKHRTFTQKTVVLVWYDTKSQW